MYLVYFQSPIPAIDHSGLREKFNCEYFFWDARTKVCTNPFMERVFQNHKFKAYSVSVLCISDTTSSNTWTNICSTNKPSQKGRIFSSPLSSAQHSQPLLQITNHDFIEGQTFAGQSHAQCLWQWGLLTTHSAREYKSNHRHKCD